MRYTFFLAALLAFSFLHAQTDRLPAHSCHMVKQKAHALPLSNTQKKWLEASLERSDTFDVLHYNITLDLSRFDDSYLIGDTRVDFRAKMDSLQYINLDLEGLEVSNIIGAQGDTLEYTHNGPLLQIELDTLLLRDDEYSVRVQYEGNPISYGFGGFYFEDGYAYNLGIGLQTSPHNLGRAWFPCFDNFVERSTYTYNVISHDGRRAFAVGTLVREDTLGGDTIIREFNMLQPIPTYLSHVAVSNYETVDYMHQGKFGAVPVQLVAKPKDTSNVRKSFEPLGETIDCMEDWYGPYPFERIGYNITSRGAMEHPTAVAYPDNSIEGGRTNLGLITHELCHHWWGNITTLSTEFDMWLKEGPASYSEHQIIECMEGRSAFEEAVLANNIRMINTAHIADEGFHPLSPMPDEWTYGVTTYDKGAAMIHNLRGYLGDSLFKIGMQSVLSELAYRSINAYEFRDQLEQSTGYDLHPFFDNWIFSPGWSDFYVDHYKMNTTADSIEVLVHQDVYGTDSLHTEVPLSIGFYHPEQGFQKVKMYCSGPSTQKTFKIPFEPAFVYANPDQMLNLAAAGQLHRIESDTSQRIDFTSWRVSTSEVSEAYDFHLAHHWIGPDENIPDTVPFRISKNHFWIINMAEVSGKMEARINYDGSTERSLDFDLANNTEDSLILLYRKDGTEPWLEYPYYTKTTVLPTDGKGFVDLDRVLSGQYAFANGPSGIFVPSSHAEKKLAKVFPNPVSEQLNVQLEELKSEQNIQAQIFNSSGQLVYQQIFQNTQNAFFKFAVSHLPSGLYMLQLTGQQKVISQNTFIKE
jgi:aminopeptidase N